MQINTLMLMTSLSAAVFVVTERARSRDEPLVDSVSPMVAPLTAEFLGGGGVVFEDDWNIDAIPRLGPLQSHDGTSQMMVLQAESPTSDAADANYPRWDEACTTRSQGQLCDMAAYDLAMGAPWAWGQNADGELGDGSTTDSSVPVQASNLAGVVAVAGGGMHSLGLDSSGRVWAWGYNGDGELGNGTTTNSSVPVQVSGLSGVVAVAGGGMHSLGLDSGGRVWAWGANGDGELGNGTTADSLVPVRVDSLAGVVAIAGGGAHSLAADSNGRVWAWGYNGEGELGNGTTTSSSVPAEVIGLDGVVAVAGGSWHSLALDSDGRVWAWGYNSYGQLGNGTTTNSSVPVQVSGLSGVVAIAGGAWHSLAVDSIGRVWAWGYNGDGELGNGTTTNRSVPVRINSLTGGVAVAGGLLHSLAVDSYGRVWAWGNNWYGQLGNGTTANSLVPVAVSDLAGAAAVSAGFWHGLALESTRADFTLLASPRFVSVAQGDSCSVTLTTAGSGGFDNPVWLSATGLPGGVAATFTPTTIEAPGSGTSQLTLSAGMAAVAGIHAVTIRATGGGKTHTAPVSLSVVPAPDFAISASPSSLSVAQGSSGSVTLTTDISDLFNSEVLLSASRLPSGVTATFSPASIAAPGAGSSQLTLSASPTARVGNYAVTITASGGGKTHTTSVSLRIVPPPDFTLSASPRSLSVAQGNSGLVTLTTTALNDFNSEVSLSASGLPAGVTTTFDPPSIAAPGSGTSGLTLSADPSTAIGIYAVSITATGGGRTHTTTVSLRIVLPPDFVLAASPASLSVAQGSSGLVTLRTTISGGFNSAVSLSASDLPADVSATFSPATIAAPGSGFSRLTLSALPSAPAGIYVVTITATGGGKVHTTPVSLTIVAAPDFAISASPSSLSVAQGSSGSITLTTDISALFNSAVLLSASRLPTGVTATFSPASIAAPGAGSSQLTLSARSTVRVGTYAVTITATGGGKTHTTSVSLRIVPPPDFTLSASPRSLSVVQGSSGLVTLGTTTSNDFDSEVSLSASGLPANVMATFSPPSIAAPGSGTSELTLSADPSTATGTYAVTITATGGGKTHTTSVSTRIVLAPDFTLAASPASRSVPQGSSGLVTLRTTTLGGFNSAVSLSASDLPADVSATFSPASISAPGSGTSRLTLSALPSAPAGTYVATITATGGGKVHTTPVSLTIVSAPDFAISASPSSLSVAQGSSGSITLTTDISDLFNSAVLLSASRLPTGVTATFSPASIAAPGAGSSQLTLSARSTARAGTYAVTITATGGGKTHTTSVSLTIVRP
jgi:alpha-tubulin suppressor-like RCC1 family protein/uncharacterized membrane protein